MADDALVSRTYDPLPVIAIEPRGWLRRQLEVQAEGLTGHLDEFWPPLADNQWLGGSEDGWERGPYYADGLVPLAHLLDDEDLLAKAETWIDGFLDWQHDDGWIGPREPSFSAYPEDTWPRAILLKVFRQHYRATGDERVLDAALEFCDLLYGGWLDDHPLEDWGKFRWQDLALGIHWLYEETDGPNQRALDHVTTDREESSGIRQKSRGVFTPRITRGVFRGAARITRLDPSPSKGCQPGEQSYQGLSGGLPRALRVHRLRRAGAVPTLH